MKLNLEFRGDIPEDWVALDSIAIIKCLDGDGDSVLCVRSSSGLAVWEALGMMISSSDAIRTQMGKMFQEGNDAD